MKLLFSNSALDDLAGIKKYYLEQGVPNIGENFVVAIFDHIETLIEHPDFGRIVPEFNEEHIREIIHPPFRVVYLRSAQLIQVIRVRTQTHNVEVRGGYEVDVPANEVGDFTALLCFNFIEIKQPFTTPLSSQS